jgi:hypothetical protein
MLSIRPEIEEVYISRVANSEGFNGDGRKLAWEGSMRYLSEIYHGFIHCEAWGGRNDNPQDEIPISLLLEVNRSS